MEKPSIRTLKQASADLKIIESEAITVFFKLMKAVEFLHEKEICHRDINPNNVLLCHNLEPYIIDFNTAIKTQRYVKNGKIQIFEKTG